jgi:Helix-turn-helix domain
MRLVPASGGTMWADGVPEEEIFFANNRCENPRNRRREALSIISEERLSDAPYVATITRGRTTSDGSSLRPAEIHWHMVFVRYQGNVKLLFVGPWTTSGVVSYLEGAEILWVKFQPGTFMPHLPTRNFLDTETSLPQASGRSFWLDGSVWQFPTYDNIDTFLDRLVRKEVLVRDPLVSAVLQGHPHDRSARTVRHRFLQATGLTQGHIRQVERAKRAAELLRQGSSISDTVYEAGYFDQPHLTRSLKRWIGSTPAQLVHGREPEKLAV